MARYADIDKLIADGWHLERHGQSGRFLQSMSLADVPTEDVTETVRYKAIEEFANRLKETPIKCGLPLFGLSTKDEIEEYFNGIMLQVKDAIDNIAMEMKGE